MLNISEKNIDAKIKGYSLNIYDVLKKGRVRALPRIVLVSFVVLGLVVLFLPWTQNVRAKGTVTTRSPEQRPQAIQTIISGRIEKWFVKEGDHVDRGDTIIFISEIKSAYFDSNLVERTSEQMVAKEKSIVFYQQKVEALQLQYEALKEGLKVKRSQVVNKVSQVQSSLHIDSMDLQVYAQKQEIARNQYERIKDLYDKGLKSFSELQEKDLKWKEVQGLYANQKNKLIKQQQQYEYTLGELSVLEQEFNDKLAKSLADQQTALSAEMEATIEASKLRSLLANYQERRGMYYILAPQSGYLNRTVSQGIGEVIKEGEKVAIIVPDNYDLAVEIYIKPQDLPLLKTGDKVSLRFDGWPAVVFSGWPKASTGVFKGHIDAIDQFIDTKGQYRLLITADESSRPWPAELSNGTGVDAFILLKEVSVWFELWRQFNGFPADFYRNGESAKTDNSEK